MAGFLYYLPGERRSAVAPADLAARGHPLAARFEPGASLGCSGLALPGPDGKTGLILAAGPVAGSGGRAPRIGFRKDGQKWSRVAREGAPEWWMGFETAARPGPADLARPAAWAAELGREVVRLEDGRDWLVPVATVGDSANLPTAFGLSPEGKMAERPVARWAALSAAAAEAYPVVFGVEGARVLPWERALDLAAVALGVFHRVGREELLALEVLTKGGVSSVLGALVGLPLVTRVMEARAAAPKASASGPNGSATGPGGLDLPAGPESPGPSSP